MTKIRRTTVILPEQLKRRAKAKAAMAGKTLTQIITERLTEYVEGCNRDNGDNGGDKT